MLELKSQDIKITLRVDAVPIASLRVTSGTYTPGIGVDTYAVAGRSIPYSTPTLEAPSLELDITPTSSTAMTLMDSQMKKAMNHQNYADLIIDAEFSVNFSDGLKKVKLADCVASGGGLQWSGGTERASKSITLTSNMAAKLI